MNAAVEEVLQSLALPVPAGANLPVVVQETPAVRIQQFDEQMQREGKQLTPEGALLHADHGKRLAAAKALTPYLDKDGTCPAELVIAADLTNGYRLPAGVTVNAKSVYMLTTVARKAGFGQDIVDRFIAAERDMF
jgi:hypothetical protein